MSAVASGLHQVTPAALAKETKMRRHHAILPLLPLLLLACGPAEPTDPISSGGDKALTTLMGGSITSKLPPSYEGWGPEISLNPRLKLATACHRKASDEFDIIAVFTIPASTTVKKHDQVWLVRVNGDEASTLYDYGQRIGKAIPVDLTSPQVDNVDCTDDGNDAIYIAWDRRKDRARWARFDGGSSIDTVHVITDGCEGGKPHQPRISYHGGRVNVLFHGYDHDTSTSSCGFCSVVYRTGGTKLSYRDFWLGGDGSSHRAYDLEWTGDQWLVAVKWRSDHSEAGGKPCRYSTFTIDYDGEPHGYDPPRDIYTDPTCTSIDDPNFPGGAKLVFSDNIPFNKYWRAILQTDRDTHWLGVAGVSVGRVTGYGGPFTNATACEYWGNWWRTAHVFVEDPVGLQTIHSHTDVVPNWPRDIGYTAKGYYPVACSARPSHTDTEIMLVMRKLSYLGKVYWGLGPQH
jgi:hypothetical protein